MSEIKRKTGPQTLNGRRWEVQLSATPTLEWMALFKVSGESSTKALPQRVEVRVKVDVRVGESVNVAVCVGVRVRGGVAVGGGQMKSGVSGPQGSRARPTPV